WLAAHADHEGTPGWQVALRQGARRYGATLGAYLILAAIGIGAIVVAVVVSVAAAQAGGGVLAVTILLLVVPVVGTMLLLVMVSFLVPPVTVVEGLGPARSLSRVWRLLRPTFW